MFVADAASVGSDAGSIRYEGTLIDAPVPSRNIVQLRLESLATAGLLNA